MVLKNFKIVKSNLNKLFLFFKGGFKMEYVYAAMLLHSAGKEIKEDAVTKVLEASGVKADSSRVKALVASLKEVNIEDAIAKAAAVSAAPAAPSAAPVADTKAEEKKTKEEDKKTEAEAAEGLESLFG